MISGSQIGKVKDPNLVFVTLTKLMKFLNALDLSKEFFFSPEPVALRNSNSPQKNTPMDLLLLKVEKVQEIDLSEDPALIAKLLIDQLSQLPEPLLSFQAYDAFLMTQYVLKKSDRVDILSSLIKAFPIRIANIISQLLSILYVNAKDSEATPESLAKIFGPILLKPMKSTYYMVNDASVIIDLVSFMIENFPLLMRTEKIEKKEEPTFQENSPFIINLASSS